MTGSCRRSERSRAGDILATVKPRLLDLFCGAGGAAVGYHRAGFEVVGVDWKPQPNYPFEFICFDALEFLDEYVSMRGDGGLFRLEDPFDAMHASPPCQDYANVTRWRGVQLSHPGLIPETRNALSSTGLPWVMENVVTEEIRADFVICGTALGLPIRRHRFFETNWAGFQMNWSCRHSPNDYSFDHGSKQPESVYRDAMGCEWMTVQESREAIPPAYTRFIAERLLTYILSRATAV